MAPPTPEPTPIVLRRHETQGTQYVVFPDIPWEDDVRYMLAYEFTPADRGGPSFLPVGFPDDERERSSHNSRFTDLNWNQRMELLGALRAIGLRVQPIRNVDTRSRRHRYNRIQFDRAEAAGKSSQIPSSDSYKTEKELTRYLQKHGALRDGLRNKQPADAALLGVDGEGTQDSNGPESNQ